MRGENPVSINQSETRKKNQSEEGWLLLRPRSNYIYSERIVIGILGFLTDHDDVHLWEMPQAVYREDQHDQASKDPCRFFTDLHLQYLWQGVQSSWHQKQAWSGQQLQLDLRSMRSVFQQTGQPSTPSCPAWETRGQAETADEETSSTWTRTHDEAATHRVTTNKHPPLKEPSCSRHGGSTWRPRDQSLVYTTLAVHSDRGSDRQPCPRPVQLYLAWDDSVHLSRDGSSDLERTDHSLQDQRVVWFFPTTYGNRWTTLLPFQPEQLQIFFMFHT